jgi:hypothetical protein
MAGKPPAANASSLIMQKVEDQIELTRKLEKAVVDMTALLTKKIDEVSDTTKNLALSVHQMELAVNDVKAKSAVKKAPKPPADKAAPAAVEGYRFPSTSKSWFMEQYSADAKSVEKYLTAEQVQKAMDSLAANEPYTKLNLNDAKTDNQKATLLKKKLGFEVNAFWDVIVDQKLDKTVLEDYRKAKSDHESKTRTPAKKD